MRKSRLQIELRCQAVACMNIRSTRLRDKVIDFFLRHKSVAYTETEIYQAVGLQFDRVSLYRTIKTLIKKSFIHKVTCSRGVVRYAMNELNCLSTIYLHFECIQCGTVYFLPQEWVQPDDVPEGFTPESFHYLIEGTCVSCQLIT